MVRDPIGVEYAAATIVFAWIAILTWRRRAHNPPLAVPLVVALASLGWSSLADCIAITTASERAASVASLALLPGASIATGALLCLGLAAAKPQWTPRAWFVATLLVEPLLIAVAASTNAGHLLVYRGVGAVELVGSADWIRGPAFWWHTGYCYVTISMGVACIAWGWGSAPAPFRRQRLALLIAFLIPLAANVAYLVGGFDVALDPTPLGFAFAGTIMAYAIFREELFTLSPVARAMIVDQIGDAIFVLSPADLILDVNRAAIDLVRAVNPAAPQDLIGVPAGGLLPITFGAGAAHAQLEVEIADRRVELHVRRSPLVDQRRRELGHVLVARDVTAANEQTRLLTAANLQLVHQVETIELLRSDLAELANRDPLTGLHNRRHLVDRLARLLAAAELSGEPLAVILFDVDRFKLVNDRFGHLAGDDVLVALARRIGVRAPVDALVTRWGGEEFVIVLPGAGADAALAFADDVRCRCAADPVTVPGGEIACTLSGGVAIYPTSGRTADELFHAADVSLYDAKRAGRNAVRLHVGTARSDAARPAR